MRCTGNCLLDSKGSCVIYSISLLSGVWSRQRIMCLSITWMSVPVCETSWWSVSVALLTMLWSSTTSNSPQLDLRKKISMLNLKTIAVG